MGWEEGKGLGAKETGITENLKVKFKGDSKGIGYNNNDYDNVWLDHQDDYEKLLKSLGQSNDHQAIASKTNEQVQTLELNSKSSKARLHYKKFTKSKDLSNASLTDLNCILGKEKRQKIASIQNSMESVVEKIEEKKDIDETNGGLFSTNKLSVSDYFASKMAAKLNKNGVIKKEDSNLAMGPSDEEILKEETKKTDENEDLDKKTKKKKSKKNEITNDVEKDEEETMVLEEQVERPKKKKSKKDSIQEEKPHQKESSVDETLDDKHIENSNSNNFNGSSLFNIYGYSPYHINANFKEILNYKIKKCNKKREWTEKNVTKNEKFYEMNKRKNC